MFTSLENKNRFLSEGRQVKPIHSKEVLEEIKNFRIEIEKRFAKNETKNFKFPRAPENLEKTMNFKETTNSRFYNSRMIEN